MTSTTYTSKLPTASGETQFKWSTASGGFAAASSHPPKAKATAPFIKGPLPLGWVTEAANLPGKSLHVGICLWYLAGLTGTRTIKLTRKLSQQMGISRDAKYDALKRLKKAGLIQVTQNPGQAALVTLTERPANDVEHSPSVSNEGLAASSTQNQHYR